MPGCLALGVCAGVVGLLDSAAGLMARPFVLRIYHMDF